MPEPPQAASRDSSLPAESLVTYTHLIYALHASAVVIGIVGASVTVVGGFLLGVPSLVAVVMNYVRRGDVRGTWLDSHFSWQIRTFWFTALWVLIIGFVSVVTLPLLGLGLVIYFVAFGVLALWLIYRVARGWMRLADSKPMYV